MNIRDLKSKRASFEEIIKQLNPTVIAITETWTEKDYDIKLEGYAEPYRNDRNKDGGGILLAVRKELENITVEVKRTTKYLESLWVVINNNKVKLRIGVVYFPQEQDQNLEEIYSILEEQIQESAKKNESIMIMGDFNSRVGKEIEGNENRVSKGGKKLIKFAEKERLKIVNSLDVCNGTWTREEKGVKSVLDYMLVDKELAEHIEDMTIHDTDKDISPFHLKRESARKIKTIYSDHNPMTLKTDLIKMKIQTEERKRKTIMTEEGREKYKQDLQKHKISKIFDDTTNLEEAYEKWTGRVMEIRKKNETTRKMLEKKKSKTMRLLLKEKKKVKKELNKEKTEEMMEKLEEIKRKVLREEEESYYRRLTKTSTEIKVNGKFNSGGFWKLAKRMKRKKEEVPHAVMSKDGKMITENQKILERYGEYYEDLLTTTNRKTEQPENQEVVEKVEEKFRRIKEEALKQQPKKTEVEQVQNIIKDLKRGKARDCYDWSNEMILDGGDEMTQSITKMADQVKATLEIPTQWNQMKVKSIHKKGEKPDLDNKRGLFLTNVVSKVFEEIQDSESQVRFDRFQNGGTKGRATIDSWIILMALIDEGKRLRKPVYIFFADLVKCFDRLWLKDCVVDLHECGMRERDAFMVYRLNEKANFRVDTPNGITKEIKVKEIVKQGTVYGPKLCCASTGKINENLDKQETIYPSVSLQAVTFMDDIFSGGAKNFVQAVMTNCKRKEAEKLWEFSSKKSPWMCIKNGSRNVEDIEVEVTQGKLGKTSVHKVLGNYVNDKGNMEDQLKFMEEKLGGVISETNKMCSQDKLGKLEWEGKKTVYDDQLVHALFHNTEAWTNLRKSDWEKLESIQGKLLRGIFGMPKTTPYWGMLYELDIIPIKLHTTYKRLMVYHNMMNSDDERVAKSIIKEQEKSKYKECWFGNMQEEAEEIGMRVNEGAVLGKLKSKWKEEVKKKIKTAFEEQALKKKDYGKKLRFLSKKGSDTYLKHLHNDDARLALKIRLNMVDWIETNYGRNGVCPLCGEEDTTEHVFECEHGGRDSGVSVKDMEMGENMDKVVELFKVTETKRRELLLENIPINFDVLRREEEAEEE